MNDVGKIAQEFIDYELGGDSSAVPMDLALGWFETNLGRLNNLIDSDYCTNDSGYFEPTMFQEEESIYKQIFLVHYYQKSARNALMGRGYTLGYSGSKVTLGDDWEQVREGDSVIKRSNRGEVAKVYRSYFIDATTTLNEMIASYKINLSSPQQVAGEDSFYGPF